MFVGLMSTILKLWSLTSRFHKFILKSSAEMYVSQSLHIKLSAISVKLQHVCWATQDFTWDGVQSWKGIDIYMQLRSCPKDDPNNVISERATNPRQTSSIHNSHTMLLILQSQVNSSYNLGWNITKAADAKIITRKFRLLWVKKKSNYNTQQNTCC